MALKVLLKFLEKVLIIEVGCKLTDLLKFYRDVINGSQGKCSNL